jgi:hypothetical protein
MELNELKKDRYNFRRNYEAGTVIHTSSGSVRNFHYVLHTIIPIGWSFYSSEHKYNELFFIYSNMLNYADKQLNLKSLAIQLVDFTYSDEDNYKINALALIAALKSLCQDDDSDYAQINSIKKIFICNAKNSKTRQLAILKQYLASKNYLNLSLFDLNNDAFQSNIFKTELVIREHQPSSLIRNHEVKRDSIKPKLQIEEKCSCGSTKKLFLNEADRVKCKVENCEICKILINLIENTKKKPNKAIICINCAIEVLFNSLKNLCSCCYRPGVDSKADANKICNLHSICDKCLRTAQFGNNECKFCLFNKFSQFMASKTENSLFEKHDNIQCSYDFCDLKVQSTNTSHKNENTPTSELKCGHSSCKSVCSFCAFKKIFEINNTQSDSLVNIEIKIEVKDESSRNKDMTLVDDRLERSHERGNLIRSINENFCNLSKILRTTT